MTQKLKSSKFEFDEETTALIDEIMVRSHSDSRVDTIRKALYLLDTASKAQRDGKQIFIRSSSGAEASETEVVVY